MSSRPTEIMTLAEAFETLFNTMQAMEAFVAAALAWKAETAEDEVKQQPAQLIKLSAAAAGGLFSHSRTSGVERR